MQGNSKPGGICCGGLPALFAGDLKSAETNAGPFVTDTQNASAGINPTVRAILHALLVASALLIPFDILFPFLPIRLTVSEVLLSVAFVVWAIRSPRAAMAARTSGLLIPLGGFVITAMIGSAFAVSKPAVVRETVQFAWMVVMVLFVANIVEDIRLIRKIQTALLVVSGIVSIVGIYQYFFLREPVSGLIAATRFRAVGFYDQPNALGSFLIGVLPLAVGTFLFLPATSTGAKKRAVQFFLGSMIVLLSAALVATFSRGSWIGFGLGGGVYVVLMWRSLQWRRLITATAFGTIAGLLIVFDLAQQPASVDPEFAGRSFSNRQRALLAGAAIDIAKDYPLLGIGFGNYPYRLPEYASEELKTLLQRDYDPLAKRFFVNPEKPPTIELVHNMLLQVLCETGVTGLIFFVWLIAAILIAAIRGIRLQEYSDGMALRVACLGGLIAILTAGLFGWPFSHGVLELLIFLAGISLSQSD